MEQSTIIETTDLTVEFGMDRGTSTVLNEVDVDIYDEEILGVVGESGSGKSMFASALLDAVVDPGTVSGEILYRKGGETKDLLNLSESELKSIRWEEIAMVFQGAQSSFNPTMPIRSHFEETIESHDRDVNSGIEHARELLEDLYMDPDRVFDSYPHELSGGMKQRTLIALSLVLEPNILVMDEPTAALDLLMQRSILSLIDQLKEKYELTIVFITHDLPLVAGLADRLAVMYSFDFVEVGPTSEIISDSAHPYTRALLQAVPSLDMPFSKMEPIEGSSPDPVNIPTGCSYHPRCPLSDNQCVSTEPPLEKVNENHQAACFYPEKAREEIELDFESDEEPNPLSKSSTRRYENQDTIIELNDLSVYFEAESGGILQGLFGSPNIVKAVDDVDLDIYEKDVVALVGESGCGKTTLGKAAIGVERPTDGFVHYRGYDVWDARDGKDTTVPYSYMRRAMQMIPQDPSSSLNPNRTVESTLEMPLKKWAPSLSKQERVERIYGMLEAVGMAPPEDYAERYPHQLSGGEKQRTALIRALLMNPDLILADEAVSALDVSLRIEMMDLMLELQDLFDTSYLFVSHNLSNARYLAGNANGRIAVMYLGQIVEIGPAENVIHNPQHPYTKVLKWSTTTLEADPTVEEPPVRNIDIPDPVNPPSGCRFHTRCPEAREVCKHEVPKLQEATNDTDHNVACFRNYPDDHEYWESPELEESSD